MSRGRGIVPLGNLLAEHYPAFGASSKEVISGVCNGSHLVKNMAQRGTHLLGEDYTASWQTHYRKVTKGGRRVRIRA